MCRTLLLIGASLLGGVAVPASTLQTAAVPSSKWTVEYADEMCTLARSYGPEAERLILGFSPTPMGEDMRVVVLTQGGRRARAGTARIGFGNAGPPVEGFYVAGPVGDGAMQIVAIDVPADALKPIETAKVLTVQAGSDLNRSFALSGVGAAMRALGKCVTDLLKSWGMDEGTLAAIVERPTALARPRNYLSHKDYPKEALDRNEQGTVGMRYMVGVDGVPRDCAIVESSGSVSLDETSCRILMSRARFRPARDAAGKPLPSLSFTRIIWRLSS